MRAMRTAFLLFVLAFAFSTTAVGESVHESKVLLENTTAVDALEAARLAYNEVAIDIAPYIPVPGDPLLERAYEALELSRQILQQREEDDDTRVLGEKPASLLPGDSPILEEMDEIQEKAYCIPTPIGLCLLGRFIISAEYANPYLSPVSFPAGAYQLTFESGYMWWLSWSVMEVPIKMVDFCASEGRFKIFAAGLTNFYVRIVVLDALTKQAIEIVNQPLKVFDTFIGTTPFLCF